jgi:hypothetical protein
MRHSGFAPSGELDLTTPAGVGYAWFYAALHLPEQRELFDALCLQPEDWNDHEGLASMLDEYGIASLPTEWRLCGSSVA